MTTLKTKHRIKEYSNSTLKVVIIKDGGEHSEVTCQRVRGSKKFKPFTIRVDNDWMPYVSDDEIGIPQQQILLR